MRLINHPVLCNYYLTYRCNASCSFCDIWEKPSPYVTAENVAENLAALRRLGVRVVDFTGGEPLLHRKLPDFLQLAKNLGFITTVTTNTLLYPKYAGRLAGLVDMLHFSLDSVDREKHNASRGVRCYDHLLRSIGVARELGERPDILFTVSDENVDELPQVYERFARQEGLVVILNPLFEYQGVGGEPNRRTLERLRAWASRPNIYLNQSFLDLRLQGGNRVSDPICKAGSATVVISPENKLILPCYHLGLEAIPINGNLEELYRRPAVQAEIAQEGRHPKCEGCVINCYMEPSMAVELNRYFWRSARSTLKYSLEKWIYA
ncbi:MAG: radical SAM protein [Bacteroidota bacterium]